MTLGPRMHSSPDFPSGTYVLLSLTSRNLMVIPGLGTPHEPARGSLVTGVKVPVGDVSVIPQPSASLHPVSFSKLCWTSSGNGAPPELHHFSELRSAFAAPG